MDWTEEDCGYVTPCWIWQGPRSGNYGWATGRRMTIHRALWIDERGPLPPKTHLHHLCHQPLCVRLEHLLPLSPGAHRSVHPESGRKNRLSAEQVHDIRTSPLSLREMARKYGMSRPYIAQVRRGRFPQEFACAPEDLPYRPLTPQRSWNKGKSKLSPQAIAGIRRSRGSLRQIAARHDITAAYVARLRAKRSD